MKRSLVLSLGLTAAALVAGLAILSPPDSAEAHGRSRAPNFRVDPFWPKPLPDNWVLGEVAGTCVDSRDHVWTVNRGSSPGGLIAPETVVATASPAIVEFDREGNVGRSFENLAVMPAGLHGCFIDHQDNVWIGGNGDGIVQKWSPSGQLLLQIGTRGLCDTDTGACGATGARNSSTTLLNQPADMAVDPANGEVFIADGYGNYRVVVFDRNGNYLRQVGEPGRGPGQFSPTGGGHPHCVVLRGSEVYACDRANDRIHVFDKRTLAYKRTIDVVPGTGFGGLGTAGSAWDLDFSTDRQQAFFYEADGGNEIVWTFDRRTEEILDGMGRPGHMAGDFTFLHSVSVDSKGNLFTGETIGGRRIQKFVPVGRGRDHD
jgi:hypothetical protein